MKQTCVSHARTVKQFCEVSSKSAIYAVLLFFISKVEIKLSLNTFKPKYTKCFFFFFAKNFFFFWYHFAIMHRNSAGPCLYSAVGTLNIKFVTGRVILFYLTNIQ